MHLILIPLFIIALLVGFYYAGDVWNDIKSSIPFIGDKELKLPSDSPFDTLK